MRKLSLAVVAVALPLLGCVSVSGPTTGPSASPQPSATARPATPTPSASAAPTPTASATPSAPPTAAPPTAAPPTATTGPTAAASSTPSPGVGFNDRDLLFDDLLATNAGWFTGSTGGGEVTFGSGALVLSPTQSGSWEASSRPTGSQSGTLAVAGELTPSSDGIVGMLCNKGGDEFFGGAVGTDGSWYLLSIEQDSLSVLDHGAAGSVSLPVGQSSLIAVECAAKTTGSLRLELWVGGQGLVATYQQADGPAFFDSAAVYAEATSTAFSATLARAQAFGVANLNGEPSAAAQELLLNHVPHDWSSSCFEAPVPGAFASWPDTIVTCFLGKAGRVGAEVAEYAQYSSGDQMRADYQARVAAFPPIEDSGSCQDGGNEGSWSYSGQDTDAGRLTCAPQAVGIRYDWTESQLNILSTLVDFDGSYGATWSDWLKAGPN